MMMRLSSILLILHSLCVTIIVAQKVSLAKPGCPEKCGNITIPYPFGIGDKCSAGSNFTVECRTNPSPAKLFLSVLNLEAQMFFLPQQTVRVVKSVPPLDCLSEKKPQMRQLAKLDDRYPYTLSSMYSRYVVIGCKNVVSMLPSYGACNPSCLSNSVGKGCNGIYCCQTTIPPQLKELNISYVSNTCDETVRNTCGYAFLTDDYWLRSQWRTNFTNYSKSVMDVTMVLQWEYDMSEVRKHKWVICTNASRSDNSTVCKCEKGFEGNPYLPGDEGCRDIDECKSEILNTCENKKNCVNKEGSFTCQITPKTAIAGTSAGMILVILLGGAWIFKEVGRKKLEIKRKKENFERNGGPILEKELSSNDSGGGVKFQIFNSKELALVTHKYDKKRILGSGGQGTAYKGMLKDGRVVAVKKEDNATTSRKVVKELVEKFIAEALTLSKINHPNIEKLQGCCLETEAPTLVYEFISNRTLFLYIHEQNGELSWETRIRFAIEVAEAISELHGYLIFHKDIKSANILLDENNHAKVSDFGTPWSLEFDHEKQSSRLLGGCSDPWYLQYSEYTDKSDVYGFGFLMFELLTRDKAISEVKGEGKTALETRFFDSMYEDNLFGIIDQELRKEAPKDEIIAFAELARKCLGLGDDKKRPTMNDVVKELKKIHMPKKGTKSQSNPDEPESYDFPSTSTTPNLNVITEEQ